MLCIVQEMSEQRSVVVSTIEVNRLKVRQWQRQSKSPVSPQSANSDSTESRRKSADCKRRTAAANHNRSRNSRQRIISENFCNEFLDQNVNQGHEQQHKATSTVYTSTDDDTEPHHNSTLRVEHRQAPVTFGKLEASPSRTKKPSAAGKLMAKRLARHSLDSILLRRPLPNDGPPAKPPRTFSSGGPSSASGGSATSSLNGRHDKAGMIDSMATLRVGDKEQRKPKVVGWKFDNNEDAKESFRMDEHFQTEVKNTAPSKQVFNPGWAPQLSSAVAWTPPPKSSVHHQQTNPKQIVAMLNCPQTASITTQTQCAVPQSPPREYIDEVDNPSQPETCCNQSANRHIDRFATNTVFSTPQRHNNSNQARLERLRHAVEDNGAVPQPTAPVLDDIVDPAPTVLCQRCQNCATKPPAQKKSFGKIALRRTKTFFESSRHILHRKSLHKPERITVPEIRRPLSDTDVDRLTEDWPSKLDTTVRKNQLNQSAGKRMDKSLDLGHEVFATNDSIIVESPRRMYERYLASAQLSPQSNGKTNNFDFKRKVPSPKASHRPAGSSPSKASGLLLLPKRLFGSASKTTARNGTTELNVVPSPSYKSFATDADDGFAIFMAEYLRRMYEQIKTDGRQLDGAKHSTEEEEEEKEENDEDVVDASNADEDFVQIRDGSSNDECGSNGEDIAPEHVQRTVSYPMEPLYAEISKQTAQQEKPNAAVYAVVNKVQTSVTPSLLKQTLSAGNLSESTDSLHLLNNADNIDLVHSIEDFLGAQLIVNDPRKVEENPTKSVEVAASTVTAHFPDIALPKKCEEAHQQSANPGTPARGAAIVINDEVEIYSDISSEPQFICTEAQVHSPAPTRSEDDVEYDESASSQRKDDGDRCSIGTYSSVVMSESICDEVLRGASINDDICDAMNRLQGVLNLTTDGRYAQAEPESSLDGQSADEAAVSTAVGDHKRTHTMPKYRQFADSLYNSIRSSSRFFRGSNSNSSATTTTSSVRSLAHSGRYMQGLLEQVAHQQRVRPQLLQAIQVCRSSAGFEVSGELVEAERLLLMSHAKETAARCEMTRINYDERMNNQSMVSGSAVLEIRRLEFRLRRTDAVFDVHSRFYYVCVCSYRNQVHLTAAEQALDKDDGDPCVVFDRLAMRFVDMQPNFQLKIEVLTLRLPQYATHSFASKDKVSLYSWLT